MSLQTEFKKYQAKNDQTVGCGSNREKPNKMQVLVKILKWFFYLIQLYLLLLDYYYYILT